MKSNVPPQTKAFVKSAVTQVENDLASLRFEETQAKLDMGSEQYGQFAGYLTLAGMVPGSSLYGPAQVEYDAPTDTNVIVITTNEVDAVVTPSYYTSNTLALSTNYVVTTNSGVVSTNISSITGVFTVTTNEIDATNYITNAVIRQVQAPQAIADIPPPPTLNGYVINYYYPSQVTGQSGGIDLFSGSPFASWLVTNTSPGSFDNLQITEISGGAVIKQWAYNYQTSSSNWTASSISGIIQRNSSVTNLSDTVYRTIQSVQASGGPIVQQTATTYQMFSWGTAPIQIVKGTGTSQQVTTYTYDPDASSSLTALQSVVNPDGSWVYYANYDGSGDPIDVYSSYGDVTLGSSSSAQHTYYDYTDGSFSSTPPDNLTLCTNTPRAIITYINGTEVSRRYTVFPTWDKQINIQCTVAGADWSDSGNLYTTNLMYTNGPNVFLPKTVVNPDKTMTTYDYRTNSDGSLQTNIVATGQPDSTFDHVIDGTSNFTVINFYGYIVENETMDIASGIVTFHNTYGGFDSYGRPSQVTHLNGQTEYTDYACCGLQSFVDQDGVTTDYNYDDANRQVGYAVVRGGSSITYSNVLDAAGRRLQTIRIGTDGSQNILNQYAYDTAGQLIAQTNAAGGAYGYSWTTNSLGAMIRTTMNPDGGTIVNYYFLDGTLNQTSGTAARPMLYAYGYDSGDQYTIAYKVNSSGGSNEWVKTYTDMLGRQYETVYAAGSGTPTSYSYYNSLGQLTNNVDPDGISTFYAFNSKGEQVYTILDFDQDKAIDWTGSDRIAATLNDVVNDSGNNVRRTRVYVWDTLSANSSNLVSTTEYSTDGLKMSRTLWHNGGAITASSQMVYAGSGYRYMTNVAADGSFTVNTYLYGLVQSVVRKTNATQISGTTYGYDAHGRQNTMDDARNGTTTYTFTNADQISTITTPVPYSGGSAEVTSYYFDGFGRVWKTKQPDGTTTTSVFYLTGDLEKTYGSRTYPVQYAYDAQGRVTNMTTWTNYASGLGASVTAWNYDSYRGFMTNKVYADGKGPGYNYTDAGRLTNRYWARGITTTYSYDGAGMLSGCSYSDSTPGVTYAYDRLGRLSQSTISSSTKTFFTYNDQNQVMVENYSRGPLSGLSVTNGYDSLLRRANVVAQGSGTLTAVNYTYDGASRLATVSDGADTASYSYIADSPLVGQITFAQSGTTRMTTTKSYDYLNRLTAIGSANASSVTLDSHVYGNNSANQRTAVTNTDGTYWSYQYDSLGQVTSGIKHWADGTSVAGQQFGYGFDDIGNRTLTTSGGDQWGANLRYASYTANNLNQYTSRTVPGAVDIIGSATNTATITVNNQPTYRNGNYYRAQLPLNNASAPVWQPATNLAVLNVGTNYIIETNITGNIYLPQTPEAFAYDADGNLTNDGRWSYTWDGENRLIGMTNISAVPTGAKMGLLFVYDSKGRRIEKLVSTNDGSTYVASYTNFFVYDGWNLVSALHSDFSLLTSFIWGSDLSGSIQGAGGVGGLLFVGQPAGQTNFVTYDGNGNVTALVTAPVASVSASYEYGPFGEVLRATGPMAKLNPFRFSTKYQDDESDLLYYGYRYLNTSTGRWLSRDPLSEIGFHLEVTGEQVFGHVSVDRLNWYMSAPASVILYGFSLNDPIDQCDSQGADTWIPYPPPGHYISDPPPPPPQYPQGFALCQRDMQPDSSCDVCTKAGNMFGGQHTYLQYVGPDGTKWGWGFAGKTGPEGAFNPSSCASCKATGTLQYGSAAGMSASKATAAQIEDCIKSVPPSKPYSTFGYNCKSWAKEAAKKCGLSCN